MREFQGRINLTAWTLRQMLIVLNELPSYHGLSRELENMFDVVFHMCR